MEPVEFVKHAVPAAAVDMALRLINSQFGNGLPKPEVDRAIRESHWFPRIGERPEIVGLAGYLPERLRRGVLCNPQIVLRLPHIGPMPEITYHVDREPDWAVGQKYSHIVGVALSRISLTDGALLARPDKTDPEKIQIIELDPGDAVVLRPDVPHSPGVNLSPNIRYKVYFRWLEEPPIILKVGEPDTYVDPTA